MTVTLYDGSYNTVDISQSSIKPERASRIGKVRVPNRYGDQKQAFGTESYEVQVQGAWTAYDPRTTVWQWQAMNTPVQLILTAPDQNEDINNRYFLISKFQPDLVQGIPTSIMITFTMQLTEAI